MTGNILEYTLLSFISLFTMVNPVSILPMYVSMTSELNPRQSRLVAFRATSVALITMIIFALAGKLIFDLFSISLESMRIVGGLIFFTAGYEMFQARLPRYKYDGQSADSMAYDSAITPIGIPLLCGPGAITTVMILMRESESVMFKSALFFVILIVMALTLFLLVSAQRIMLALGETGKKVLLRITGLIVMVIAVDFFFGGLKPIVKDILSG